MLITTTGRAYLAYNDLPMSSLVTPTELESVTARLEILCSIQLSYGAVKSPIHISKSGV